MTFGQSSTSGHIGIWGDTGHNTRPRTSIASSSNTYLMPASPSKKLRPGMGSYKPSIAKTCGQRPACLVNASVTYVGNDTIFAFGGFDQYTDEGIISSHRQVGELPLTLASLQSRIKIGSQESAVELGRQLRRHSRGQNGYVIQAGLKRAHG